MSEPPSLKTVSVETQTEKEPDLKQKLKRYEEMLKSESEANEELAERIEQLEQELFRTKQEKDRLIKE